MTSSAPSIEQWIERVTDDPDALTELFDRFTAALLDGSVTLEEVYLVAEAAVRAQRYHVAQGALASVLELHSEVAPVRVLNGLVLALLGHVDSGLALIRTGLEQASEEEVTYEALLTTPATPEGEEAAWQIVLAALDGAPYNATCYRFAAETYDQQGKLPQSLSLLESAARRDPGDPEMRELLIQQYLRAGRLEEALRQCEETLSQWPQRPAAFELQCSAYLELNRPQDAVRSLTELLRLIPTDATVYLRLGALYQEQEQFAQALTAFSRVLGLQPGSELAAAAEAAIAAMDGQQFQRLILLAAEDRRFRLKIDKDPQRALTEYGFHLSPRAQAFVSVLDVEGLLNSVKDGTQLTHH